MAIQFIKFFSGLILILGLTLNASAASVSPMDSSFPLAQSDAPADEEKKKVEGEEEEPDC